MNDRQRQAKINKAQRLASDLTEILDDLDRASDDLLRGNDHTSLAGRAENLRDALLAL